MLLLEHTLAAFGPQTQAVRAEVREAIRLRIDHAWSGRRSPAEAPAAASGRLPADIILGGILALSPQNDAQRWQQSQALSTASEVLKTRWLSLTGGKSPVSTPFLIVIIFWLSVLFWSFGLFAPRNAMVTAVLLLAALSVSASVLLILEMQTPFSGLLHISNAPLRFALENMGK
jgi:hypothetical protein